MYKKYGVVKIHNSKIARSRSNFTGSMSKFTRSRSKGHVHLREMTRFRSFVISHGFNYVSVIKVQVHPVNLVTFDFDLVKFEPDLVTFDL